MSSDHAQTLPEDRVPFRTRVAYSLGGAIDMWGQWLYPGLCYPVFNLYLGLAPDKVGLALMLIRLFDAVTDPFFGWLSDNTRTRFGRRRPYILGGALLSGLGLPLMFFIPAGWTGNDLFWWMLLTNLFYVPIVSSFNMPFQSLGAELTPDYHERTRVMSFKGATQKIFEIAFFLGLPFTGLAWFYDSSTGSQNMLLGVQVYCSILGLLMMLAGILIFCNVKERYYDKLAARGHDHVTLRESFYETLKCRPFRLMLSTSLCFSIGTSMVGSLGYYATVYYVAGGDTVAGNNWNGLMGIGYMVGGFLGAPALAWVGQRTGKRPAALIATGLAIAAFGGSWFLYNPAFPWLQLCASGAMAFTSAGFNMLNSSIGADIMDYDELQTGKRREGAFSACGSWINKAGNALGFYFSGKVLILTGFLAEKGAQSPETIFGIRLWLAAIPVIGIAIAMTFLWRFPLTQSKMQDIRRQLEARRGRV